MTKNKTLPVIGKRYYRISDLQRFTCSGIMLNKTEDVKEHGEFEIRMQRDGATLPYFRDSKGFWDKFEELPNQEPTKKVNVNYTPSPLGHCYSINEEPKEEGITESENKWFQAGYKAATQENKLTDKVEEALKNVRERMVQAAEYENVWSHEFIVIKYLQNLVTAMQDQQLAKPTEEAIKEGFAPSNIQETPISSTVESASKSIWKPISELPEDFCPVIVRMQDMSMDFANYCTVDETFNALNCGSFYTENLKEYCLLGDFINHQSSLEKRIEKLEEK